MSKSTEFGSSASAEGEQMKLFWPGEYSEPMQRLENETSLSQQVGKIVAEEIEIKPTSEP